MKAGRAELQEEEAARQRQAPYNVLRLIAEQDADGVFFLRDLAFEVRNCA